MDENKWRCKICIKEVAKKDRTVTQPALLLVLYSIIKWIPQTSAIPINIMHAHPISCYYQPLHNQMISLNNGLFCC